ncbi:MAG: 6,7-dimethyl-8-ribityllumazine synthase [Oligoflexia bacterium]|nr:6,7-dimethyl-8-ribityllumazine synthase [Oligoflexia bacterium]
MKIGLVVAMFNREVTERLEDGAKKFFEEKGFKQSDLILWQVPGAYEIPLASKILFSQHKVDAVVALGAVIKGETKHFDYVCNAVERGCSQVSLEFEKPVGFGVLTTDTFEQAWARSCLDNTNKGREAAEAAYMMLQKVL